MRFGRNISFESEQSAVALRSEIQSECEQSGMHSNRDFSPKACNLAVMSDYSLVGKRVRVHLYDRNGISLGTVVGRVADVAQNVPVGRHPDGSEIRKDLAYVIGIESPDPETPFRNSAGDENEGWFALQDLQVVEDDLPSNISFN